MDIPHKNVVELTAAELLQELSQAALKALDIGEVQFHRSGPYTAQRNVKKIRTCLQSPESGSQQLGLEFFRCAHETWAVYEQLVAAADLSEYWQVWQQWALEFFGPLSSLHALADDPHYEDARRCLTHEQQEWLDVQVGPRRPLTHKQLKKAQDALRDLMQVMSVIGDEQQRVLDEELVRELRDLEESGALLSIG